MISYITLINIYFFSEMESNTIKLEQVNVICFVPHSGWLNATLKP